MDEWVSMAELYAAYLDCRKRKRTTESCATFEIDEAILLDDLHQALNAGTYEIGKSNAFCVTRPRVREIFAADFCDRIIHHLLMIKTGTLFEDYFIPYTFNCRKGKGTTAAHKCALQYAQEYADGWVIDCDIKSFFMQIPKRELADRLEAFLRERYTGKDIEQIVWLTRKVVLHKPQEWCVRKGDLTLWQLLPAEKSLFTCADGLGMAIGNLTSQIYANFYLSRFDHWIMQQGVGYCRYVDDFKIFVRTKQQAHAILPKIRQYLQENDLLTLHPRKLNIQPVRRGFEFVGAAIKGDRVYVGNRTVGNAINMVRLYNALPATEMVQSVDKFVARYNSYAGYMCHYKTYAIRWRVWNAVTDRVKCFVYLTNKLCVLKARAKYKFINQLKQQYYGFIKCKSRGFQKIRKKPCA